MIRKLLLLTALWYANTLCAMQPTLSWQFSHFPPYHHVNENGIAVGGLVDIIQRISAKTDIQFRIEQFSNRRFIQHVQNGSVDFWIGIPGSLGSSKHYLSSQRPIGHIELSAFWVQGTAPIVKLDDLNSSRVILIAGFTYASLRPYFEDPKNRIRVVADIEDSNQAIEALKKGRADYLIYYTSEFQRQRERNLYGEVKSSIINRLPVHFLIAKRIENAGLKLERLESSFDELYKNRNW